MHSRMITTRRILLADDEVDIIFVLAELLKSEGNEVEIAGNGAECVDLFKSRAAEGISFDLLIVDYRMPKKDGGQVIEEIRAIKSDQKILLISAFSQDVLKMQNQKHLEILTKPFDAEGFLDKVLMMMK
jgi:CheY-like chemotaxis protein